jgi:broad specificity phosphatase PhoE
MGKPRLILIIRHAQSEGNRDKTIHQKTPDHKVGLTAEGHQQAHQAGEKLRELLRNDDNLHFFISPYRRTRETTEGILDGLCSNRPVPSPFARSHIKVYEEPRLREQDFGNFQPGTDEVERLWRERADYGHFFYRIPNGESGADVYDRITSFNGSLWRRFSEDDMSSVAVLVTHGLCSRVFLMAWYHYSVEFFEDLRNINHCEFLVMKLAGNGRYVLQNKLRRWTDLRRERAERRSISAVSPSSPDSTIPNIPVRRWASKRTGTDAAGTTGGGRPIRQNTADLFKDDEELEERVEDIENPAGAECTPEEGTEPPQISVKKIPSGKGRTYSPFRQAPSPLKNKVSSQNGGIKAYLGRDGGGSKSGAASPLFNSDEDNGSDTPASVQSFEPHSLAKALMGEFDDPNRVLADALGDQSDAEVDEADKEVGTKEREESEMEKILEDERRERSHRGDIY